MESEKLLGDFNKEEMAAIQTLLERRFYINPDPLTHLRLLTWSYIKQTPKSHRCERLIENALHGEEFTKDFENYHWLTGISESEARRQALLKVLNNDPPFNQTWEKDPETLLFRRKSS